LSGTLVGTNKAKSGASIAKSQAGKDGPKLSG
jgi:hypothetical protein